MLSEAEQIALWSDKLWDISAMGLHFSRNIHDERDIRRDNWFTSKRGIRKVMGEVEKIGRYFDLRQIVKEAKAT
jgi:hypothetical protein